MAWLLAALVVIAFSRRLPPRAKRIVRAMTMVLIASIALMATPFVSSRLEHAALPRIDPLPSNAAGGVVVVLAGGSILDSSTETLTSDTADRVLHGVATYRRVAGARMVMSGRGLYGDGTGETRLMRELAVQLGVPGERVITEPRSGNTFEHPRSLLQSGIVKPDEVIYLVTEPTHIRRAGVEFRRCFAHVVLVPTVIPGVASADLVSWIPQADSLEASTSVIRESVGMGWYALKAERNR
jgi:uncharacterized SAM-binding protein YcdF (DUF218 family)